MRLILLSAALGLLLFVGLLALFGHRNHSPLHARIFSPGPLSAAHRSLETDCRSCHSPFVGVTTGNCVPCHAASTRLLEKQSTRFHASVETCKGCHIEHMGRASRPVRMDHGVLVSLGFRKQDAPEIFTWLRNLHRPSSPPEQALDCASCHSKQDRHQNKFGQDCGSCHSTNAWTVEEFVHPSPRSTDCAQCHKAPPSHYMEHFHMISEKVAGIEHAEVRRCYLCHQTSSWNDIRGVGWYKHH